MAIAPSKLGDFVAYQWRSDEYLARCLRAAGLVRPDVPDADLFGVFQKVLDEHEALDDPSFNSPEERVRVFLAPFLTDKGTRWAVPLDSLRLPDEEEPGSPK